MAETASSLDDAEAPQGVLRAPGRPIADDAQLHAALQRLERSVAFRHSAQLRRLLRHLVLHAQRGEESALREIAVGVAALGRDARTFDPKSDPIVRTEARRLRAKLAAYYASEGSNDAITIELPKGSYVPIIRARLARESIGPSVAVLPFVNFTGDAAREPFCDALTDELIDALAQLEGLRVVARTSAFRFKNQRGDIRDIAMQLGVSMVLEGSVQATAGRMRVIAQLIAASDGTHAWSQAFDAGVADLAAVQETLADEIVRSLERAGALAAPMRQRPVRAPRGTQDPEARDRYDRALGVMRTLDTRRYDRARDLLVEALARDPGFARAHHLLALDLCNRASMSTLAAAEAMPAARAHLERALVLDPGFAQARALLAWITGVWDREWMDALVEIRRAVRSAPGNFAVRNTCGNLLALFGRFDEAEAELERARELDPLHLTPRYNAAIAAWYAGRHALAVDRCNAILDVDPAHAASWVRIAALIAGKRCDSALTYAREFARAQPGNPIAVARLAEALAANGDLESARRVLEDGQAVLAAAGSAHYAQAHVYAVAGDIEAAWPALDAALSARESNTEAAGVNPYFVALRADGRWNAFAQRHRLPPVVGVDRTT
jgi:serine/threonine-protein kinase